MTNKEPEECLEEVCLTQGEIDWIKKEKAKQDMCDYAWNWFIVKARAARVVGGVILGAIMVYHFLWDGFVNMVEKALK